MKNKQPISFNLRFYISIRNFLVIAPALFPFILTAKPADIREAQHFTKPLGMQIPLVRPSRDHSYLSENGNFIIHYNNSGDHSVPQNYTFNDSIPDYVYRSAQYLEDSFVMLRDSLGFRLPPPDHANAPEIDVYFTSYFDNYGMTYLESQAEPDVWTSYITLSTNLEDSSVFYTPGLDGLKVTCAHELFHVFQLGYIYRDADYFYFEMSSVWFEEYMYPDVNDYHSYFNQYTGNWNYAVNHANLYYNNVGFNLYIDKHYSAPGNNIINTIWERIPEEPALDAIGTVLDERGDGFAHALCNWGSAQVLCYPYSAENFTYGFDDAQDLPTVSFSRYPDNVFTSLNAEFELPASPMVSYYKLREIPPQALLFETDLTEGLSANLICLDGTQSMVYPVKNAISVIDGKRFNECILVIGSDQENAAGSFSMMPVPSDLIVSLYPNPSSSGYGINIRYVLTEDQQAIQAALYDLRGRRVFVHDLDEHLLQQGLHTLTLDLLPHRLSSGIYFFTLHTDERSISKKLTIIN